MRERSETKRQTSGSQTRQRVGLLGVRLTVAERAKVDAAAAARGMTAASYARALLMEAPLPEARPALTGDEAGLLGRLLGQLGKVGSNLNQLTRLGNQGQIVAPSALEGCLEDVRGLIGSLADLLHRLIPRRDY
jgi:hypothetical protein